MPNPHWPQFAQLTATPELFAIIDALGVEVPREGRPRRFQGYRRECINGLLMPGASVRVNVEHYKDTGSYGLVVCADGSSRYLSSVRDIRRAQRIPAGSPTDKALLRFLAWWGLEPPPSDSALRRMQRLNRQVTSLPHWAVPQPPQGGEVADA